MKGLFVLDELPWQAHGVGRLEETKPFDELSRVVKRVFVGCWRRKGKSEDSPAPEGRDVPYEEVTLF
jgi:hypothetical protein